jgi:hypothetical protein
MQNARDIQGIRDQAQLDQRAWVGLTDLTLHPLTPNEPILITANTVNSGNSYASHVERTNAIVLATREPRSFPKYFQ